MIFTRLSVHCADRITATINSYGERYSSSVSASGRCSLKYSMISLYLSFFVIAVGKNKKTAIYSDRGLFFY